MNRTKIADNDQYSIEVSTEKNRAYLVIKGFWRNVDAVPNYINDWKKAMDYLKDNFTILNDAVAMKSHPQDVKELHGQVLAVLQTRKMGPAASLIANSVTEVQFASIAKGTDINTSNFSNAADAEKWLDAQVGA